MADASKKTTRSKKTSTPKAAGVPTAKAVVAAAVAAEAKGQPAPAAVKAAVPTPAAKPSPAPAAKVDQKTITKAERQRLVEQAAYFRAEKHGFHGDPSQHWATAEADVDADLKRRNVRLA